MRTEAEIEQAAIRFLSDAVGELHSEHVLPAPEHARFMQVGREYFGPALMEMASFKALEALLDARYPERFRDPLNRPDPEFASTYIFSFLEAVLARTKWPISPHDEGVERSVAELMEVLGSTQFGLAAARHVSHLSTANGEELVIGDVTVIPDREGRWDLLQRMVDAVPMAPSAWHLEPPFAYDPPHSVIVTHDDAAGGDPYKGADRLSNRLERFLLSVRLLTASTTQTNFQVCGTSRAIGPMRPVTSANHSGAYGSLVRRTAWLSLDDAPAIEAVSQMVRDAAVKRDGLVATSFDVALSNYNRSYKPADAFEQIVDLTTSLEALLADRNSTESLSLRLATRAALLLQTPQDSASALFHDVRRLYGLRSKLVHGAELSDKRLRTEVQGISTMPPDAARQRLGVALGLAVDRLRDIVRRTVLARLCLASGDEPLWRWGDDVAVEAEMLDPVVAERWRTMWHAALHERGARAAFDRPRAAVEFISAADK